MLSVIKITIPIVNDELVDFDSLFSIYNHIRSCNLSDNFEFDMANCHFLRPNAVAFLACLIKLIEFNGGTVIINWDKIPGNVLKNLMRNGFCKHFRDKVLTEYFGNSIPLRIDHDFEEDVIIDYLKKMWLGHSDLIIISSLAQNAIAGAVWEIYSNYQEHSKSKIGIFTCGQVFPIKKLIKLTILDFGVGIPQSVRDFAENQEIRAKIALEWAFREGTTTKPGSRGLGLKILMDFVKLNEGKLEIFSNEGYGIIEKHSNFIDRSINFHGTLVNITLRGDGNIYRLVSEIDNKIEF